MFTSIKKVRGSNIRGFTLIELMIVIVILGLLMTLVAPRMFSQVSSTKTKTAAMQMEMLSTALDAYFLDVGSYPEALEELRRSSKTRWNGPYMPRDIPLDPWDRPYIYKVPGVDGNDYLLRSYGRDGSEGGEGEDLDIIFL